MVRTLHRDYPKAQIIAGNDLRRGLIAV
jgi:hypothetical protein